MFTCWLGYVGSTLVSALLVCVAPESGCECALGRGKATAVEHMQRGVSVRLCAPLPVCTKGVVVAVADTGGRRGLKSGLEVHFTFKPRRVNKGSSSAQDTDSRKLVLA